MRLSVTPDGIDAILHSLENNELSIVFKKVVLGNGADASEDDWAGGVQMSNPLVTINAFTEYQREGTNDYITLKTILNNANVEDTFKNTETGVYIEPLEAGGSDILFAYGYTDEDNATVIPGSTEYAFETTDTIRVYVGATENVSAILSQYTTYATKVEFDEHLADTTNPHQVTKQQVGLGNVDNTSDSDAAPEFTEADSFSNVNSGETASTLWGKVKKFISTLLSHINNTSNPHITTYTQVGAAAASHNHSATNITSGVLGTARGGTGGNLGVINYNFSSSEVSVSAEHFRSIRTIKLPAGTWILTLVLETTNWAANGDVEVFLMESSYNNATYERSGDYYTYHYQEITLDDRDSFKHILVNFIIQSDGNNRYVTVKPSKSSKWSCDWHAVRLI